MQRSLYFIDKSDPNYENYVQAIATHAKYIKIVAIDDKQLSSKMTCKELPEYLKGNPNIESIEIECESTLNSDSTIDIFPKISDDMLHPSIKRLNATERLAASEDFKKILVIHNFFGPKDDDFENSLVNLKSNNINQALYILYKIKHAVTNKDERKFGLLGALHLPDSKFIFIQLEAKSFDKKVVRNCILSYSEQAFRYTKNTCLDIDEGFSGGLNAKPQISTYETALNIFFNNWKNNNYQGLLFPIESSGFEYTNVYTRGATIGLFKNILPREVSENISNHLISQDGGRIVQTRKDANATALLEETMVVSKKI